MSLTFWEHRGLRRAMVLLVSLAALLLGTSLTPARADTPNNTTRYIDLTLSVSDDPQHNRGRFNAAITQLRIAAGHEVRGDNVWLTSGTAQSAGLVEFRIWGDGGRLLLTVFINPQNLYVGGWRSVTGETYLFNDASTNIRNEVTREVGPYIPLPLGGSYQALVGAAVRDGREEPSTLNIYALTGSLERLANVRYDQINQRSTQGNIGVDMLRLVGLLSESARFPLYRDSFGTGLDTQTLTVLTPLHQELRTEWGRISEWARRYLADSTIPALVVAGVATFRNWNDIVKWLRAINGRPESSPV
jgi:hypothetical protein